MEICSVRSHAVTCRQMDRQTDRQMDGRTDMMKVIGTFHNYANEPNKK